MSQGPGDHLDRLFRAAWALTGDRHQAEALVQDTYAKVVARSGAGGGDDLGHLLRVLESRHRSRFRRHRRRPAEVPPEHPPAELFARVAALSEDARSAVVAVDVVGLSDTEAAELLRVQPSTLTTRLQCGRTRVAEQDVRAASQSVSAPMALRESLERRPEPRSYPSRLTLASIGFTLMIIATMAALLAPSSPTVETVATAALSASERSAPTGDSYLPGFTATGARTDSVEGRTAKTVIYTRGKAAVRYTIVDGDPLDLPGSKRVKAGSLELAPTRDGDVNIVAWHANGKTRVLASKALDADALVALIKRA